MPRNQGTSRKGKPSKHDRESGMGKSLLKLHANRYRPRMDGKNKFGDGGMTMTPGVHSIGIDVSSDGVPVTTAAAPDQYHKMKSVLELQDLDDFLFTAELAQQEFKVEHERMIVLDDTTTAYNPSAAPKVQFTVDNTKIDDKSDTTNHGGGAPVEQFVFTELSVPRRPQWDVSTTPEELDIREKQSFLQWRRSIAQQEENLFLSTTPTGGSSSTTITSSINGSVPIPAPSSNTITSATPFEKNIEVWRQLWRVIERSDCLLQLVDGRNPLFYVSEDLKSYVVNEHKKPMMILINKSDYLSPYQRQMWYNYLTETMKWDPNSILFFSAVVEQQKLDTAAQQERYRDRIEKFNNNNNKNNSTNNNSDNANEEGDDSDVDGNTNPMKKKKKNKNRRNIIPNESDSDEDDYEQEEKVDENDSDDDEEDSYNDHDDEDDNESYDSDIKKEIDEQEVQHPNETATTTIDTVDTKTITKRNIGIEQPLTRTELLDAMMEFATKYNNCQPDPKYNRIQFGMVGFPNVGKSSVINVLVGSSKHTHGVVRVAVANQPGKTKHFQTLLLPDREDMMLCDCPGLVFPSFVSNTADLIAAGVYPIAQMRDHWPVIQLICQRIPRPIIEALYGIHLPAPNQDRLSLLSLQDDSSKKQQHQLPPPTPEEFLGTLCIARGMLAAASGIPDYQRAARMVVKDYADGRLLYCHAPPSIQGTDAIYTFHNETIGTAVHHTEKLQEKLLRKQKQAEKTATATSTTKPKQPITTATGDVVVVVDDDILALLDDGSSNQQQQQSKGGKKGRVNPDDVAVDKFGKKGITPKSKWGKKDRKNRNKDPYGCHTSDDSMLLGMTSTAATSAAVGTSTGLIVQGGKRYTTSGYIRPMTYPNPRQPITQPQQS